MSFHRDSLAGEPGGDANPEFEPEPSGLASDLVSGDRHDTQRNKYLLSYLTENSAVNFLPLAGLEYEDLGLVSQNIAVVVKVSLKGNLKCVIVFCVDTHLRMSL